LENLFGGIYKNKRVFLTGHTGFKGSWLALWLKEMGAEVFGYSLNLNYSPSHYQLLNLGLEERIADIMDFGTLKESISSFNPDIVIHMAAQPLVLQSYREPRETFETNVMGTVNVLDACRGVESVKAIVNITTDKCYENKEWVWGYRENDPMGGYDPYSASKGCAELVTSAYRNSFFNIEKYGIEHNVLLASVRAGNVIGGGDWADDRLIPDIMKSVANDETVVVRSPESTRPWQHVLEPLSGYLLIGEKLLKGNRNFAEAWNFGPTDEEAFSVKDVVEAVHKAWPKIKFRFEPKEKKHHEANLLKLDCSKAHFKLGWKGVWDAETTFQKITEWYKCFYENGDVLSEKQLNSFVSDASKLNMVWTIEK